MSTLETCSSSCIFRDPHSFIALTNRSRIFAVVRHGAIDGAVDSAVDDAVSVHALRPPESERPGGLEVLRELRAMECQSLNRGVCMAQRIYPFIRPHRIHLSLRHIHTIYMLRQYRQIQQGVERGR